MCRRNWDRGRFAPADTCNKHRCCDLHLLLRLRLLLLGLLHWRSGIAMPNARAVSTRTRPLNPRKPPALGEKLDWMQGWHDNKHT